MKKYYYVNSKRLADAILWVSGLKYYTHSNSNYDGMKSFSFEDTQQFRDVLSDLSGLKRKYN